MSGAAGWTRGLWPLAALLLATIVRADSSYAGPRALSVRASRSPPPPVVAVVEVGGLNVFHEDFRIWEEGAQFPQLPPHRVLTLPTAGSFEERVAQAQMGPLGRLRPRTLYWIRGTRLLIYVPPDAGLVDIFDDRFHGTGVASAAIGRMFGTNPSGWLVYVPGGNPWPWLVAQPWIEIISTSYIRVAAPEATCREASAIRRIAAQGRLVFSATGNQEQVGLLLSPAGVPESYQVGGVDRNGRTYLPPQPGETEPGFLTGTPTRPYETGDRFRFPAASSDALQGPMPFGGTSGAAPSTAGRAQYLIDVARRVVGDGGAGVVAGFLAQGRERTSRGPLSDGRLASRELQAVLHHVAIPADPASPVRYLIEGYGALNEQAIDLAVGVLSGEAALPDRPQEDAMHESVEEARAQVFSTYC